MKNKFKTMIWILGVCLITATVIVACQKENENDGLEKINEGQIKDGEKTPSYPVSVGLATKWWEVDKQIEWIAKGFVPIAEDIIGLKSFLHNNVTATNTENRWLSWLNVDSWNLFFNNLTWLKWEHVDRLDLDFPTHNYISDFFSGFEISGEYYNTNLWIPEANTVDTTLLHVVCPMRVTEKFDDLTTGYFLDANGSLDSLLVDWEDDPTDDYYIWVINYFTPVKSPNPLSPQRDGDYCGDGYCNRDIGEDVAGCVDCDPDPAVNPGGVKEVYQIKITSMEVYHDEKQYFESWLSNQYDFRFVGCIYDANDNILSTRGETISPSNQSDPIFEIDIDRNSICRRNGSRNWNCPSGPIALNQIVLDDFRDVDNLMLIGYESNGRLLKKHADFFRLSRPDFNVPNGASGIWYDISCGRNDRAVAPFYELNDEITYGASSSNKPPYSCAEFDLSDVITVNSFSGPGSTITIDNNEWRYTLMLIIKQ